MSKKNSLWLDRGLITGPYVALALNEKQFHKAMNDCHIPASEHGDWIKTDHSDATVHYLDNDKKELCCIVAIRTKKKQNPNEIVGLLVHEATHIWQQFCERIGELSPSCEFEAYSIQAISQTLISAYSDLVAKK